ncbi:PREDICTED: T-lymphocyte activation antigen CD86 [Crocodylus porosus]|uniref:CD86 molecule n=1 Tax=Crocodylus porosus TaxID=8502 RepID=A0A7M4FYV2_CROPO|nr:PREDICTED: T-lymphocyte activation antigen CD86 [Crocodylus porosus]
MELCEFFLHLMTFLPGTAVNMLQEEAFVNHTAYLQCNFHNPDNIDVKELIVFWQKESEVVNEVYRGEELSDNLDPKYINRTKMDMNTWTLSLLNVGIMDEGQYVCIIQHKKSSGLEKIYDSKCQLFVIANYSQPEIVKLHKGTVKPGTALNLSCSSSWGYPEPTQMSWQVSKGNLTEEHVDQVAVFQDDKTKLYKVTITRTFQVPMDTHINISCLVYPTWKMESLVSKSLCIAPEPVTPVMQPIILPAVGLIAGVVIAGVVLVMVVRKRSRCNTSTSHSSQMGTEVNRQPNNKDEDLKPMTMQLWRGEMQSCH